MVQSVRTRTALLALVILFVSMAPANAVPARVSRTTQLTITADFAVGLGAETWKLQCNSINGRPLGGNHPNAAAACALLKAQGLKLFAPVPKNAVCTMIYGGDEKVSVKGLVLGKRISTTFVRTNGCEIVRYARASALFTVPNTQIIRGSVTLDGAPVNADVVLVSGTRYLSATSTDTGFILRLPAGTWIASAGVGRSCAPTSVTSPGSDAPITIACTS